MKRYDFTLYKDVCFWFLVLNALTFPLSPYFGSGLMKRGSYDIFIYIKLAIFSILVLIGAYMWISNMIFLKQKKTANK